MRTGVYKLSDFHRYLITDFAAVPAALRLQTVKDVIRDICERTDIWQEELDAIDVTADTASYTLSVPYDAVIRSVVSVTLDDIELDASQYTISDLRTLVLEDSVTPTADSTGALVVVVALLPTANSLDFPEWFIERYRDTIIAGVTTRLKGMANRPWSDPQGAYDALRRYNDGKALAVRDKHTGFKAGTIVLKSRKWV